jgi:hypothetical protein
VAINIHLQKKYPRFARSFFSKFFAFLTGIVFIQRFFFDFLLEKINNYAAQFIRLRIRVSAQQFKTNGYKLIY